MSSFSSRIITLACVCGASLRCLFGIISVTLVQWSHFGLSAPQLCCVFFKFKCKKKRKKSMREFVNLEGSKACVHTWSERKNKAGNSCYSLFYITLIVTREYQYYVKKVPSRNKKTEKLHSRVHILNVWPAICWRFAVIRNRYFIVC